MIISGDGEKFEYFNGKETERTNDIERIKYLIKEMNLTTSRVLTIRFILPKISKLWGVWELSTKGSRSSIESIINTFDNVKKNAGTVANIPFNLNVAKVTSQRLHNVNGKIIKPVFPVLELIPNISQENMISVNNYLSCGNKIESLELLNDDNIKLLITD